MYKVLGGITLNCIGILTPLTIVVFLKKVDSEINSKKPLLIHNRSPFIGRNGDGFSLI